MALSGSSSCELAPLRWPLSGVRQLADSATKPAEPVNTLYTHLTVNWDIKAILCCCFSSPPSAWLAKPRCITTHLNLELCPVMHCLRKSLFSFLSVLSGAISASGCAIHRRVRLSSCRNVSVSVLDSVFSFFLSFCLSSSVLAPARPFLFNLFFDCWTTPSAIHGRCGGREHLESSEPRNRRCSRKHLRSRQHCCPSLRSITKGNPFSFWIFDRGSSGHEQNGALNVCLDRYNMIIKRDYGKHCRKSDLTLTVFSTKVYINIRYHRPG